MDYSNIIAAIVGAVLAAPLAYFFAIRQARNDRRLQQDKDTFARLTDILTKDGLINYIRDHDFGAAYQSHIHWVMEEFSSFMQDPRSQFIDKRLNQITHALANSLDEFNHRLAGESIQTSSHQDLSRIAQAYYDEPPPYRRNYTREEFETVQAELNNRAEGIWKQYSDLVATAKRKL